MRKDPMPLGMAIALLFVGIFLGSIFIFGTQYWNAEVTREDCVRIETDFFKYEEIRQPKRPATIKEIAIDCTNNERYFIDGVSINTELREALSELAPQEHITLLIHPNSNKIVELSNESGKILTFEDTIHKLGIETTGFLFLGIFMYVCSLVGLYYIILHFVERKRTKK